MKLNQADIAREMKTFRKKDGYWGRTYEWTVPRRGAFQLMTSDGEMAAECLGADQLSTKQAASMTDGGWRQIGPFVFQQWAGERMRHEAALRGTPIMEPEVTEDEIKQLAADLVHALTTVYKVPQDAPLKRTQEVDLS